MIDKDQDMHCVTMILIIQVDICQSVLYMNKSA